MLRILSLVLITLLFIGCSPQQPKLGNTKFPEVLISAKKDIVTAQVARVLLEDNFNIVSETNFSIDYRAPIGNKISPIALALMQSIDGSNIEEKGIDFNILNFGEKIKVQAKPYLYKTYKFNSRNPLKQYLENNHDTYNSMVNLLTRIKQKSEQIQKSSKKEIKIAPKTSNKTQKIIELSRMLEKGLITKDEFINFKNNIN